MFINSFQIQFCRILPKTIFKNTNTHRSHITFICTWSWFLRSWLFSKESKLKRPTKQVSEFFFRKVMLKMEPPTRFKAILPIIIRSLCSSFSELWYPYLRAGSYDDDGRIFPILSRSSKAILALPNVIYQLYGMGVRGKKKTLLCSNISCIKNKSDEWNGTPKKEKRRR